MQRRNKKTRGTKVANKQRPVERLTNGNKDEITHTDKAKHKTKKCGQDIEITKSKKCGQDLGNIDHNKKRKTEQEK
jgi:hypothetical protein